MDTPWYRNKIAQSKKEPSTKAQHSKLFAMGNELGWDRATVLRWLELRYKVKSEIELSKEKISEIFRELDCIIEETLGKSSDNV